MALTVKRQGRFSDYFVETTTVEDFEARLPLDASFRETAFPLPPVPTYESRRSYRRGYAIAFGVSLAVSGVLLELMVRAIVR